MFKQEVACEVIREQLIKDLNLVDILQVKLLEFVSQLPHLVLGILWIITVIF